MPLRKKKWSLLPPGIVSLGSDEASLTWGTSTVDGNPASARRDCRLPVTILTISPTASETTSLGYWSSSVPPVRLATTKRERGREKASVTSPLLSPVNFTEPVHIS